MTVLERAEALAREAHQGQLRKGGRAVPYVSHLASVIARLSGFGVTDQTTLAAAWLHDVLEDQPAHAERLRAEMPAEVVATVEALSEPKRDAAGARLPKEARFHAYVGQLTRATDAARRVSCADKIDNLESLLDAEARREQLLVALNTRPGQQLRHLGELRGLYATAAPPAMMAAFDDVVARLAAYIERWLPGRAVAIAAAAHLGQFDRAGAPYVLHPLRMMLRARTRAEKMAAVPHDVVEDTDWTLARLTDEGFPPEVVDAVEHLTKREGEDYDAFIGRALEHPVAARVKLLDLEDNMDLTRMDALSEYDLARLGKYHRARARILAALPAA